MFDLMPQRRADHKFKNAVDYDAFIQYEMWEENVNAWASVDPVDDKHWFKVGVKDTINTVDFPTQMGSPLYKGFTPGNDARVVSSLKQRGIKILGKTHTAEFGVHHPPPTRNPHDMKTFRTPGTSSSGSAVAVASGMVDAALGTQTAGSIIRPASWNGVYGFKPSFGLIPRTGILKTTDTLDTVGFFATKVSMLRLLFNILRVRGPNYPWSKYGHKPLDRKFKIAILQPPGAEKYATQELLYWAYQTGMVFKIFDYNRYHAWFERAEEAHRIIYHKCLSYYFKREMEQPDLISDTFKDLVAEGLSYSNAHYKMALQQQKVISNKFDSLFDMFDILINLSSAGHAPENEAERGEDSCAIWTLCGMPVVNIPVFTSPNGLPFGLQVIARRYEDHKLLDFVGDLVLRGLAPFGTCPKLLGL